MSKKKTYQNSYIAEDILNQEYLVAKRNEIWCIDATFISSGTLILVIDLATRLILGDYYLHQNKANQFQTEHVKQLLASCMQARHIQKNHTLILHSDRGQQFANQEFALFCKQVGLSQSMNREPFNNQVIESLNRRLKEIIRLRVDPQAATSAFKPGSFADPIRKLTKFSKDEVLQIVKDAIETHNNTQSTYNQALSPYEFDNALFDAQALTPEVISAKNDNSSRALKVQDIRDQVTLDHANSWLHFFKNWKNQNDLEFEAAKRERMLLYEQNRLLISKIEEQSDQIKEMLDLQRLQKQKEDLKSLRRAKRAAAIKQEPRDAVTPEEFQQIMQSIKGNNLKQARLRVAFTLLYLTGLRVSNLLQFKIANLNELIEKQSTLLTIIKRGGPRKLVIGREAKHWFKEIQSDIAFLQQDRDPSQPLFFNKEGEPISRVKFNEQLNDHLKAVSALSGKRIFTHSFRVTMITELLQEYPIQDVKNIIGHKDIRTTEVYNRIFPNEHDIYKAIQHVYKRRNKRRNKAIGANNKATS